MPKTLRRNATGVLWAWSRGVHPTAPEGGRDPREDRSNGISLTTNKTNFHEWGEAASSYSRVGTARPLASQDSGAQRRSCWMQWRPCRKSGSSRRLTLQGSTRFRAECDSGGASSSHAPFSSREAAVLRGLRGARGDGDGAWCWQRLFRFGSSRRSTLQGFTRCRAE